MTYALVKYIVFLACFGISMYALSSVRFEKFCSSKDPRKVTILLFLLSFVLAYLSTQAILDLTIFNGLGG